MSSIAPTTSCASEATAKTTNANVPTSVAEPAMPPRRSLNTCGKANVVDWKTRLDTAAVKKMIAVSRISVARISADIAALPAAEPGCERCRSIQMTGADNPAIRQTAMDGRL